MVEAGRTYVSRVLDIAPSNLILDYMRTVHGVRQIGHLQREELTTAAQLAIYFGESGSGYVSIFSRYGQDPLSTETGGPTYAA